eukprot:TRINITY_DN54903_c0_g1_i2.p1 TRINITY_DN54903_c0_g1~~TRINITY_DN54903_c0_g1_i2.p1  ORF type:complete len:303 (+),score=150.67 TRINITY_DN54903_c0_g1_i2:25-933(+)
MGRRSRASSSAVTLGAKAKKTPKMPKAQELLKQLTKDERGVKQKGGRSKKNRKQQRGDVQGVQEHVFKNGLPGAYVPKRQRTNAGVALTFDDADRKAFVNGFHKRKVKRRTYATYKKQIKLLQQRQKDRKEKRDAERRMIQEYDRKNAKALRDSLAELEGDSDSSDGDSGSAEDGEERKNGKKQKDEKKPKKQQEEEFDNDDAVITVTTTALSDESDGDSDDEFNLFRHRGSDDEDDHGRKQQRGGRRKTPRQRSEEGGDKPTKQDKGRYKKRGRGRFSGNKRKSAAGGHNSSRSHKSRRRF